MASAPTRPVLATATVDVGEEGLAPSFFSLFGEVKGVSGQAWLRRRVAVGVLWLLLSIGLAFFVSSACGRLPAALALLLLAAHPVLQGLGSLASPWLSAAMFSWLSLLFLQAIALPTVYRRRAESFTALLIRILAMLGSGIALGLASTAWQSVVWILLVVSSLFLLSLLFLGVAGLRVSRRVPISGFALRPWAWIRRGGIWALAWFLVVVMLLWIWEKLGTEQVLTPASFGIELASSGEVLLAWLSLPGILLLALRSGSLLWYRSRLCGQDVLFASLLVLWLFGPAMAAQPDPMQRLLAAPVFAASVASMLGLLRRRV